MNLSVFILMWFSVQTFGVLSARIDTEEIRVKRSDIDLQTCIGQFAIHKDKIIRTQDSRAMGAKYLNEIDLDSREECLRLCCETDNCDVFVYEEKNSGSCYLFHCGPPEDFKCKFTHHVNYSSAILTVNRHLPDLESQIKLTKHEQDLTKLRKPEMPPSFNVQLPVVRTTPPTTTTTALTKEVLTIPKTKPPEQDRKCSRFQFECRSSGECIAIYNACDGIPQCADGSDEAPELECPEAIALTTQPPPVVNHPNSPLHSNSYIPLAPPSQTISNSQTQEIYRPPAPQQHASPPLQNPPKPDADFLRPVSDPRNQMGSHSAHYEPQPLLPYQQFPAQQQNWIPHQSNQMPPQLPQYVDKNSHIFNHKESGIQVPDGQETRYNKYKGAMQTLHRALGYASAGPSQYGDVNPREYPKVSNYYGEVFRQPLPQLQENWPPNNGQDDNYNGNNNQYVPDMGPSVRENWRQNMPPPMDRVPNYRPAPPELNPPQNYKPEKAPDKLKQEQEKMAHELKHSKEHFEQTAKIETKEIKIEKHLTRHDHDHDHDHNHDHSKYPEVAEYKMMESLELQDGVAQTPGSAILSLTLGLIITCVMAVLIGCRLRVVRRRLRRGGKSYAHDADYLVNGMYL